jgi:hypothetical protein
MQPTSDGTDLIEGQMIEHLRQANQVAKQAIPSSHHPFGAIPVASDYETVLLKDFGNDAF